MNFEIQFLSDHFQSMSLLSNEEIFLKILEDGDDECKLTKLCLLSNTLNAQEVFTVLKKAIERKCSYVVVKVLLEKSPNTRLTVEQVKLLLDHFREAKKKECVKSEHSMFEHDKNDKDIYTLLLQRCDPYEIGLKFVDLCGKIPSALLKHWQLKHDVTELEWKFKWNEWTYETDENSNEKLHSWRWHCLFVLEAIGNIESIQITEAMLLYVVIHCRDPGKISEEILSRVDINMISSELKNFDDKFYLIIPKNKIGGSRYVSNLYHNIALIGQKNAKFEKSTGANNEWILKVTLDFNSSYFLSKLMPKIILRAKEIRVNKIVSRQETVDIHIIKSDDTCEDNKVRLKFLKDLKHLTKMFFYKLNSNWVLQADCVEEHPIHGDDCVFVIRKYDENNRVASRVLLQLAEGRGFKRKLQILTLFEFVQVKGKRKDIHIFFDILREESLAAMGIEEQRPFQLTRLIIRRNFEAQKPYLDLKSKVLPNEVLEKIKEEAQFCLVKSKK